MTTAQAQVRAGGLLETFGSVKLTVAADHDPDAFYRTRSGLYVWDDFRSRVVAKAKPVAAGTAYKINIDALGENLTDAEIEAALPQKHLFDESAACAIIAELIAKQPGGGEGHLQNTGYANLLYTRSCVVRVGRVGLRRRWHVKAWGRDGDWWLAGSRVLSPAN